MFIRLDISRSIHMHHLFEKKTDMADVIHTHTQIQQLPFLEVRVCEWLRFFGHQLWTSWKHPTGAGKRYTPSFPVPVSNQESIEIHSGGMHKEIKQWRYKKRDDLSIHLIHPSILSIHPPIHPPITPICLISTVLLDRWWNTLTSLE
jgi:hypothetical protein